jgi:hypothetical protein
MSPSTKLDLEETSQSCDAARSTRSRPGRLIAGTLVAGLAVTGLALTGGESASASPTAPNAQSVGRLVDGTVGNKALESLVDVHDARATAPGTQSVQNPLTVTLLNQLTVNLNRVIDLPTSPTIIAGAVNQVAVAHADGHSYGAAGAVSNSGGINLGGSHDSFPALGTLNLGASALPATPALTALPGAGSLPSLGGIHASFGAVSALAQTDVGGAVKTPSYNIADLNVDITSPALGGVLTTLSRVLKAPSLSGLPAGLAGSCSFHSAVLAPFSTAGGAVVINPTNGGISISLAKLLKHLRLDINHLPANTDLVAYLLDYLASPSGLAAGVRALVTGLAGPLQARFSGCLSVVHGLPLLDSLLNTLTSQQSALVSTVNGIVKPLQSANPLKPLATALKGIIDIGVNVESGPGIQAVQSNPDLLFTSKLKATANQATAVVENQTLVRALEINVLAGAGSLDVPAAGKGVLTVALANAAAGPSAASSVPPTTSASGGSTGGLGVEASGTSLPTSLPTGVPAGFAKPTGSPELPLVLLVVGLLMASGGAVAWKLRGKHVH